MTPFVFVLAVLAVYRITLLLTDDEITAPARDAALRWLQQPKHRTVAENLDEYTFETTTIAVRRRYHSMRCSCGFRVWRPTEQPMSDTHELWILDPAGGGTAELKFIDAGDDLAVLSEFNVHRNSVDTHAPRFDRLPILLTCPWCASMHIAPIVIASAIRWGTFGWWQLAAGALAASALTGIAATIARP